MIPAEARSRNKIKEGDTLVVVEDDHRLHVKSLDQAIADARTYFKSLAPASRILLKELLADRQLRRIVTSAVLDPYVAAIFRRCGLSHHDVAELTQETFRRLTGYSRTRDAPQAVDGDVHNAPAALPATISLCFNPACS